ncbi:2-dehydro-3-deoxygalactonokinase [Neolewinella xylanilytica]|uniref:2-dehydro-3-deoxygalactonokinase n=1 Tax=Neolewinella xylanilytica TaxID=1514080 RepID=A0A2S6I1H0_9BACT|nr:2-dehydro-3-deoxygalactonokinase [Neolewinella xylanilytica]PPK85027.1 2-dehydro-3-deoxygalactonokinase [Neolewinella xylanilytica]
MAASPAYFISCDWGTTNFRLRVVESGSQHVVAEVGSGRGIREVFEAFQRSGTNSQRDYFANYLLAQLVTLPKPYRHAPVVASGMASSNMGIRELPYAELPIGARGENLVCEWLDLGATHRLLLVSGVKGSNDIMRGEEVQAVGLIDRMENAGTLVLPGTHSKHLRYTGGVFTDFRTYMTGELFELLSRKSLLSASVEAGPLGQSEREAFDEGVLQAMNGRPTGNLFSVRVQTVLNDYPKKDNYHFLSGLLIGEELRQLTVTAGSVYLAAAGTLSTAYSRAFKILGLDNRLVSFDAEILRHALLFGQTKLLLQHAS